MPTQYFHSEEKSSSVHSHINEENKAKISLILNKVSPNVSGAIYVQS
jgi:hypothetical protein